MNPLGLDGAPRTILLLLALWLLFALAVAAGVVLGCYVLLTGLASAIEGAYP